MSVSFSFLFIFVITPAFIIVAIIYSIAKEKRREEKLFRVGIIYLKSLRTLLMYIQQHRGLSNSYLNGNNALEAEIIRLETIIENEINNAQKIDAWILHNTKWESIIDHWSRLNNYYKTFDPESNLKQHNMLIANLLYLIDDIAYAHQLGKLGLVDATDTDWRYLLSIAEYIGQARALGMGAVSRGECSNILRIQLNHLREKIESHINRSWSEKTLCDFRRFLTVIEEKVIVDKPNISPEDYFSLATGCIEDVLIEFDRQIEKIQFHRK